MPLLQKRARIYEINTCAWLRELSVAAGYEVKLDTIPASALNEIAELHMDAVWLMGVWERSPEGSRIARNDPELDSEFRGILGDYSSQDMTGSPYCVRRYGVDERLGGERGLAAARKEFAKRGIGLILDYVPNHVAPDHPWVSGHPEYFIAGNREDLEKDPSVYMDIQGRVFARGRDPYFPPWPDVLQLNAFHPGFREAARETLCTIARQCDGMRCDMAMLMLNDVFARTWGARAGIRPEGEFWREIIGAVRQDNPEVLFMAEAYWDLERDLMQLGFDCCYDKRLYDRLATDNAESVRLHLLADPSHQERLVRFIENHDEPRSASVFPGERLHAAAVTAATLPGYKLFHQGQFEGNTVRLPVFLTRKPFERVNQDLLAFYARLLDAIDRPVFRRGRWWLCGQSGWPDNGSCRNIVSWCWGNAREICLVVVNLSGDRSQSRVHISGVDLAGRTLMMKDLVSGDVYERSGSETAEVGLYVDLGPWAFHVLLFDVQGGETVR